MSHMLLLSDDLIDASRVIGECRAAGLDAIQCKDQAALLSAAEQQPALVIIDLHNPGLNVNEVVTAFAPSGTKVIAFGSHVDAARLKSALRRRMRRGAARSAFFDELEANLRGWSARGD